MTRTRTRERRSAMRRRCRMRALTLRRAALCQCRHRQSFSPRCESALLPFARPMCLMSTSPSEERAEQAAPLLLTEVEAAVAMLIRYTRGAHLLLEFGIQLILTLTRQ
jgi:hypothetical protein